MANETRKALQAEGKDRPRSGVDDVIETMISPIYRKGKATGAGFYDHPENGKTFMGWLKPLEKDTDLSGTGK